MELKISSPNGARIALFVILITLINSLYFKAKAQLRPANAIYYFNEYLMNPAMAGKEKSTNISLGYRQQMTSFSGAPQNQFLTVDHGFDSKSGLGIKINNDKAGLLKQTSIAATYAYHLPLGDQDWLSFGVSATFTNHRLNDRLMSGDPDDPDATEVNQRKTYIDSDFGVAYRSESLTIQGVFPNMIATLNKSRITEIDYTLFYSAITYRIVTGLGLAEPKLAFRGIKGFKNVVDFGTNFLFNSTTKNQFNLLGIYHSSNNATFGLGITVNNNFSFNSSYTMGTSQLQGYTIGDLELGVSLKL